MYSTLNLTHPLSLTRNETDIPMTHLLHYPTAYRFACSASALGRRDTRTQCDPANTTCPRCLAWIEANPEWDPVTESACPHCHRGDSHHYQTCVTLNDEALTDFLRALPA